MHPSRGRLAFYGTVRRLLSIYSKQGARVRNITSNPRVALNFGGDGRGGDVVILSGIAEIDASAPSADKNAAWVAKYAADWESGGMTAESFAQRFCVPLQIHIHAVSGR